MVHGEGFVLELGGALRGCLNEAEGQRRLNASAQESLEEG